MYRLRPYSQQEWRQIEINGFLRFFLDYVVETMILGIAIFAIVNLLVNYAEQTELMQIGFVISVLFPPFSGVFLWRLLKRKFARPSAG